MNPEIKTTIEQLMEECFALKAKFGGCSYLHLTTKGNGKYEVNAYGMDIIEDTSAIGALTKLKMAVEARARKDAATEIARAEKDLAKAQARLTELVATHNTLTNNDLASQ